MTLQGHYSSQSKTITKGCPQGSILGPSLRNLVFDSLLRELSGSQHVHLAYADDLFIIIAGNSMPEIELAAQQAVDLVSGWFTRNKLLLSVSKTVLGELKGTFRGLLPNIILSGTPLHLAPTFKYLAITFGSRLSVDPHLQALQQKTIITMYSFGRMAYSVWGLKFPLVMLYYRSIFLAIVSYGAATWVDLIIYHKRKRLRTLQRQVLLRLTKAYKTSSTESLQVVAGPLPIDLHLLLRKQIYQFRRQGFRRFGTLDLTDYPTQAAALRCLRARTHLS